MIKLKGNTKIILYSMLFFPILGHIYLALNFPKTISVFFVFVVFIWGLIYVIKYNKYIEIPKFLIPLALYMIYIPIRSHLSVLPNRVVLTQIYYDIIQVTIFLTLLIVYNTNFNKKFIDISIKIFKITIVISAIVSIIQVFYPTFIGYRQFEYENIYSIRRSSIFTYEYLGLGFSYIPLLSITIGYLFYLKNKIPSFYLIIGGISAILSNTRFIIIGFILLSMQILFANKNNIIKNVKFIILFISVIFILLYIISKIGYNLNEWYNERLFAEGSITETTRYKAIDNFLIFFPKYWIFGNGEYNSEEVKYASNAIGSSQIHVGYLAHLVSYGVIGSFFLFSFWFLLAKKLYKTAKVTNYWGSFFAFLTYLFAQLTLVHYSIFFYGLIFAFIFDKYINDQYLISQNPKQNYEYKKVSNE